MKKMKRFAYVGAIALLSLLGFSACSSGDDAVAETNPDYNAVDNTVKAQLAISLSSNTGNTMRMANDIVQGQSEPVFRGMQDMHLIAFSNWVAKSAVDADAAGNIKAFNDKVINLGSMDAFDKTNLNAKVYRDLSIPVGTKAFMFYGRAKRADNDNFKNGVINAPTDYTAPVKDFVFSLQPIQPDIYETTDGTVTTQHGLNERASALIDYVKNIRATAVTNATVHAYLNAFQPTAGSSASIQFAVQDLWDAIRGIAGADDDITAVRNAITTQNTVTMATIDDANKVTLMEAKLIGYPENISLPDGAAAIDWEDPDNPKAIVGGHNGSVNVQPLNTYVYPAELMYRANTTIGVSPIDKVSDTYQATQWTDITGNNTYYTWDSEVLANTRSIALKEQIQYAVARLDLQVKAAASTLKDYAGNDISVPSEGFPISAVLIGHQRNVNFQFGAIPSSTVYTIYDKVMTETMAAKAEVAVGTNKTLVLQTNNADETAPLNSVNVCVEFTNNSGRAFVSKHGIVPAGGKFYLVGQLDLTDTSTFSGDNGTPKMIFKQDYVTKATFTISELGKSGDSGKGLGAAYNVIPDLKTPQLEVAFSVNLEWKEGLSFNTTF